MDISQLESALRQAWTRETSADPEHWTPENPAWGQCAVTALVVNDHLGGKLVWAEAVLPDKNKMSHYFNLIDGQEIDLSRMQFPQGTPIPAGVDKKKSFPSTREYVLSFEATRKRYEALKQHIQDLLRSTENYI